MKPPITALPPMSRRELRPAAPDHVPCGTDSGWAVYWLDNCPPNLNQQCDYEIGWLKLYSDESAGYFRLPRNLKAAGITTGVFCILSFVLHLVVALPILLALLVYADLNAMKPLLVSVAAILALVVCMRFECAASSLVSLFFALIIWVARLSDVDDDLFVNTANTGSGWFVSWAWFFVLFALFMDLLCIVLVCIKDLCCNPLYLWSGHPTLVPSPPCIIPPSPVILETAPTHILTPVPPSPPIHYTPSPPSPAPVILPQPMYVQQASPIHSQWPHPVAMPDVPFAYSPYGDPSPLGSGPVGDPNPLGSGPVIQLHP
eukprot:gene1503-2808_t